MSEGKWRLLAAATVDELRGRSILLPCYIKDYMEKMGKEKKGYNNFLLYAPC